MDSMMNVKKVNVLGLGQEQQHMTVLGLNNAYHIHMLHKNDEGRNDETVVGNEEDLGYYDDYDDYNYDEL